jgi:hypothetical protein
MIHAAHMRTLRSLSWTSGSHNFVFLYPRVTKNHRPRACNLGLDESEIIVGGHTQFGPINQYPCGGPSALEQLLFSHTADRKLSH